MAVLKMEGAAHVRVTDFCACGLLEASDAWNEICGSLFNREVQCQAVGLEHMDCVGVSTC